ncbi:unnamed protein product [Brassica oleracea]
MWTATSLGRDPLFMSSSSSNSDRAAAIKIRFADIIVKSSSNKSEAGPCLNESNWLKEHFARPWSEATMNIRREKLLLQKRQLQEKAYLLKFEQDPLSAEKVEKNC